MTSISSCPHFVYRLVDPRDQSVFYVGITINLYERFKQHMQCDGTNAQKDERIQEILASGHLPLMLTIERVESFEQARKQEKHWSWHYTLEGVNLLNRDKPVFRYKPLREIHPSTGNTGTGRWQTFASVVDMLVLVHDTGQWPDGVSPPMQRYYKRRYPEYFGRDSKGKREKRSLNLVKAGGR